ncbi:MAG: Mevalonate kinase [uncultured Acidilobus sp. CIS]|nr:MAG: Mevalonate kinase [uncultured Acidilobus sp. CIS]
MVYGGTIVFRRGQGVLERLEGGLSVPLVVADSGLRRSTAAPVLNVLRFLDRVGPLRGSLLGLVEQLIDLAWSAIRGNQLEDIGALMNINHGLLSAIGVSTPELEELVYAARRAGALGSKLTGAGWGGSIIAITRPGEAERVAAALTSKSGWVRVLGSGTPGARVIKVNP